MQAQKDTLQVQIPAGVEDGATLRIMGRGEAAPNGGGRPGNLYVVLRVEPDERFERDGADLHTEVAVSFPQLVLGDQITVPTIDGEAEADIPPGTQPGDALSLAGRGLPRMDGRGKGAIVAHLKLVVPTALSAEEEAHLRAYAAAGGQRVSPERELLPAQKEEVRRMRPSVVALVLALTGFACSSGADVPDGGGGAGGSGVGGGGGGQPAVCVFSTTYTIVDGGGLVAMFDTATLTPPNAFRYERRSFMSDAGQPVCEPAMPACARSGTHRRGGRRGGPLLPRYRGGVRGVAAAGLRRSRHRRRPQLHASPCRTGTGSASA